MESTMKVSTKKLFGAAAIVTTMSAAPLKIDFAQASSDISKVVRVNDACGQATSCAPRAGYICSTVRADYMHYTCNTGCANNDQ